MYFNMDMSVAHIVMDHVIMFIHESCTCRVQQKVDVGDSTYFFSKFHLSAKLCIELAETRPGDSDRLKLNVLLGIDRLDPLPFSAPSPLWYSFHDQKMSVTHC